jgi:D-hexose-6-phosphate mutarotase
VIELRNGTAAAEIVPERGAICTRLRFDNDEILYLDNSTLEDLSKNVRGGIPVLFPIAGKPDPGSTLKQHGWARNLPWEPTRCAADKLECRLSHDGFNLLLAFTLSERALRLDCTVQGEGPFQLGFHPYFAIADKSKALIETSATHAFDNLTGKTAAFTKPDFTQGETDLHLLDHREAGTLFQRPAPLQLSWSPEFTRLVLWTLPGKPFICVEPWTARGLGPGAWLSFEIAALR